MPASQPVDYIALCRALVEDESLHPDDTQEFRSLAELLETLREAVKGCGKTLCEADAPTGPEVLYPLGAPTEFPYPCGDDGILCNDCMTKYDHAITALTSTGQGGTENV